VSVCQGHAATQSLKSSYFILEYKMKLLIGLIITTVIAQNAVQIQNGLDAKRLDGID
jgi:hypothetical protein